MTDIEWFVLCFRWWTDVSRFTLDNERSPIADNSYMIPPEGWVP
jgi:hypothetical protein